MNIPTHAKAADLRHTAASLHTAIINNRATLSFDESREMRARMKSALLEAAAIEAELSAKVTAWL